MVAVWHGKMSVCYFEFVQTHKLTLKKKIMLRGGLICGIRRCHWLCATV